MTDDSDNRPPVALEQRGVSGDQRMFSPTVARNSAPILAVLKRVLPTHGVVLEIGCGTGEHAVHFAGAMRSLTWLPSDPDADSRASTASWIKFTGLSNVLPPLDIDVCARAWGVEQTAPFDAIVPREESSHASHSVMGTPRPVRHRRRHLHDREVSNR